MKMKKVFYKWFGYTLELSAEGVEERLRLSEVQAQHGGKALCTRFVSASGRLLSAPEKHWLRRTEPGRKSQAPEVKEPFAAFAALAYAGLCEKRMVPFGELIEMCSGEEE